MIGEAMRNIFFGHDLVYAVMLLAIVVCFVAFPFSVMMGFIKIGEFAFNKKTQQQQMYNAPARFDGYPGNEANGAFSQPYLSVSRKKKSSLEIPIPQSFLGRVIATCASIVLLLTIIS